MLLPQTGVYHVMLRGYRTYSGVALTGSYSEDDGDGDIQTYSNTTDHAINDNSIVESPVMVSGRVGSAPTHASVTVDIKHTYISDLVVDLVAPDGSTYSIHDHADGSADDIYKTMDLDLSSETLNGSWKLRASDNQNRDTGYVDAWSITF